jgi:hypothetical protein
MFKIVVALFFIFSQTGFARILYISDVNIDGKITSKENVNLELPEVMLL